MVTKGRWQVNMKWNEIKNIIIGVTCAILIIMTVRMIFTVIISKQILNESDKNINKIFEYSNKIMGQHQRPIKILPNAKGPKYGRENINFTCKVTGYNSKGNQAILGYYTWKYKENNPRETRSQKMIFGKNNSFFINKGQYEKFYIYTDNSRHELDEARILKQRGSFITTVKPHEEIESNGKKFDMVTIDCKCE